jgi:hypothetical protein
MLMRRRDNRFVLGSVNPESRARGQLGLEISTSPECILPERHFAGA